MTVTTSRVAKDTTNTSAAEAGRLRKVARRAGWAYIITFLVSLPTLILKKPLLEHSDFVLGAGSTAPVLWGGLLDVLTAFAGIATAVLLFPVVRRRSETAALGFVTTRVIEAAVLFVGALSILSVVTLRQDLAGAPGTDTGSLVTVSHALVAVHKWSFLLGPGLMAGMNALCLGYVMFRSGLVGRVIPTIGLVGAPLLLGSTMATFFGAFAQTSPTALVFALPDVVWELSIGVFMVVKGFKPAAVVALGAER